MTDDNEAPFSLVASGPRTLVDVKGSDGLVDADSGLDAFQWQLSPAWWLVDAGPDPAATVEAVLVGVLRSHLGATACVVDVSSARAVLVLTGAHALSVLRHGTSIDLATVAVGRSVQGLLARTPVVIGRPSEHVWRVYVPTSYARYLSDWLEDASEEYVPGRGQSPIR